jgi:hypothetical protein
MVRAGVGAVTTLDVSRTSVHLISSVAWSHVSVAQRWEAEPQACFSHRGLRSYRRIRSAFTASPMRRSGGVPRNLMPSRLPWRHRVAVDEPSSPQPTPSSRQR